MDDTLSIGDIVCFYSEERLGFVYSSQASNYHNEVAVGYNQDRARPPVADQHIIAFEICAANRYKLTKKHFKLRSQSDHDPDNLRLKNSVAQAKIAADAEKEDNDLEQKRNRGKKVLYGHTVQLRHLFTNKYVHVSTTKTSRTESNNMAVELQGDNAKHAQFRIMPRYKVKAEGDVVQVDDQIVLESVKSPGQFLHVSQKHLGSQSVYGQRVQGGNVFELNLSVRQSGFTLYRKYKPTDNDETKIKVGDPVRFYHKEMEAYLVAEGLFDDELTEDVHLRLRPVDQSNPKTMFPSSSAITYWQIELQDGPVAGGILKWEQQCRIVHMCSRRYLAVSKKGDVTLTTDNNDPSTVFRLHAVIRLEDNDDISFETYARVEHVLTGFWLHALADEYMKKQDDTKGSDDRSMGGLKYTTAQLKKIAAIQEKQYDDAFTLQYVEPELVEIFHYMAGMVPFIQKLVADKKSGAVLNAKMAHDVISSLKEMEDFMVDNSVPSKNRQKLMRNLRVVELLVSLLRVPYMGSPDQAHLTNIFVEAYNVLYTYLMGDSRKNELYIAKYIDFFLTQFEYKAGKIGLNAAHMVMELIRDNRKIVDRITEDHIDKFVELLKRDKNYRYLELLSVLCVCDGVSIADNQAYITQKWLGGKEQKSCVYLTDLGEKIGKTPGVVYVSTNNGRTWKELKQFAQENMGDDDEEYLFLERQLELFGMLCHGQNDYAIQQITKELDYLSWNEAFTCLSDTSLPDRLRAKYCELIITLFVDIGDNVSVVDRVKLSYSYDDIDTSESSRKQKDKVDKSSSQTYQYFPALRDWISTFLGTNGDMTASQIGNNMLVQQVLRLVHYLVKYGFYYKSTDIKKLLEPLMSLLDGRNDKPYPNMDGKEAEEVLQHFRKHGRFQKSQETKAIVDAKIQALEVLNLFFNFIFNLRMEKFMNMFKETHSHASMPHMPPPELGPLLSENFDIEEHPAICKTSLRRLQDIFNETAFFKYYEITEILMDLSHYDYDEMIRKSMQLLNRYFSAHRTLFTRAVQAQVLITDGSVAVSGKLNSMLPALRRLATAKLTNEQAEELSSILDQLIMFCHLEGELEEQHNMNQSILYNHGVLEDAFTILSQNIDVKLLDQYGGLRRVFQKTFMLLRAMARGNHVVQGRLFDRLDMLLSKEGAAAELSECLTEVFTGNSTTCMKVMGYQVQKVMSLVAQHREEIPQFLDLLNAIVKVEELDLPLKRNQSFVMTYFMQYRADIATVIDRPEQERELILTGKDSKELNYLIAMVDLLATCAEGENRYIESICQTIFKIGDLLKVLNHSAINCNLKRPFLRFFLWVYLNTAGGMIESGAGDLPHDPQLWTYVDSLNADLQRMADYTTAHPDTVKQLLKRPPVKSNDTLSASARGSSEEEEMRSMLHYYFDAVMPFLQIFCRSYYQPDKETYPSEPARLSTLTLTFEKFMDTVAPLISIERQLKNLVTSMTSLITASSAIPLNKMEEFHQKYGGGTGSQDVRSDARKKYEEDYSTEEDINGKLNVFAVNMQMAYGGVNNVHTQIGFPSQAEYSEMGGDEELPLGQEFQEHLKCFINDRARDPNQRFAMAQKLVKQLEISQSLHGLSEEEKLEQLELDVKCLQLMRGLVHNEIVKLPKDWELSMNTCKKQLRVIENVQTALDSYDVVVSVLGHLSRPQDDLVRELLAFMAALLFSGNENVQKSMFGYFTGTREETFFFAVKSRMQLSGLATREKRLLHAMHMAKVEELVAQAKALRKAMKEGKAGAGDALMATHLGSMLSVARRSKTSLSRSRKNMRGSRLSVNRNALAPPGKASGMMGSTLAVLGPPGLQPNGSMLMGAEKPPKPPKPPGKPKKTAEVAPAETVTLPEVKLDDLDEDEMLELTETAVSMSDELEFKDDGYIELVLRVLGLMCDNQHKGLQDYLREQPDNIKSVNLVAETTRFLNILYGNVNDKTAPLIIQLFDTLVEFTSGNFHNQAIVFDNKVCEYINHMLRIGHFKGCSLEQMYSLKKSIATLVRALSEENPPDADEEESQNLSGRNLNISRSSAVTESGPKRYEVLEYIDSEVLMTTMVQAYQDMHDMQKPGERQGPQWEQVFNLVMDVGFVYFHTLCRKMDLHPSCTKQSLLKTDLDKQAWEFFAGNTLSIEILKDDVLQKIHFRVKDKNVLREEIKEKFKYSVDRTSPSNKLRDFMDWSVDIIHDIKYQRKIHANPLARFFVQAMWWLSPLNLMVTFILCMIVMVTWKAPASTSSAVPDLDDWPGAQICIYAFGGLHNLLSLFIVISYFLSNHPTFPGRQDVKDLFLKFLPADKGGEGEDDEDGRPEKRESHLEVRFFSITTFYYLLFLACSLLGTAFYGYFFPFHLLHMAMMNQLLQRVILAVTRNGVSLILVAILGLAIIFMFSLVAFGFYREYLDPNNGRQCRTAYECFITLIHHGFVEGMYTTFEQELNNLSFSKTLAIVAFDVVFFILITTIGLNIIFGIIVDTFSELRDSKWQIDNDMKSTCFICSRESYDFERQAGGFEKHVKEEHNQWAYLFFFIHLDETRPNDYSALELHVHRLLEKNNFDFFPLNRALSLAAEEDSSEKKLETLMAQVEYLVAKMKEEEATKEREKEKQRQQEWESKHKLSGRAE